MFKISSKRKMYLTENRTKYIPLKYLLAYINLKVSTEMLQLLN